MARSRKKHKIKTWQEYIKYAHKKLYKNYGKYYVRNKFKNINKEFESGNYYKKIIFYHYLI